MWSAVLWPLAVVAFEAIVFATALFLVRLAARDRLLEEQQLLVEQPAPATQEPVVVMGLPKLSERMAVHELEPEKEPSGAR